VVANIEKMFCTNNTRHGRGNSPYIMATDYLNFQLPLDVSSQLSLTTFPIPPKRIKKVIQHDKRQQESFTNTPEFKLQQQVVENLMAAFPPNRPVSRDIGVEAEMMEALRTVSSLSEVQAHDEFWREVAVQDKKLEEEERKTIMYSGAYSVCTNINV
jgi:hypothetical protein